MGLTLLSRRPANGLVDLRINQLRDVRRAFAHERAKT